MPEDVTLTISARTRRAIENIEDVGDEALKSAGKIETAEAMTSNFSDELERQTEISEKLKNVRQEANNVGIDPNQQRLGDVADIDRDVRRAMSEMSDMDGALDISDMGEAVRQMDEMDEMADKVAHQQGVLGSVTQGTVRDLQQEADAFVDATEGGVGLAEAKNLAKNGNQALARAAGITSEKIDEEAQSKIAATRAAQRMEEAVEAAGDSTEELGRSMTISSAIGQGFNQSLYSTAFAASRAEDEVEELNDEVEEFALSALGANINIGPLSFRLNRLAVQIPQLLILFGGLITSLAGVSAAAIGAAGAFATLFGAGLLAMGEQVKEQSSEVESSLQGIQEILSSFAQNQLREAIEPLMNPQTVNMTRRALAGVAAAVEIMSSALARIQGTLSGFQSNIGDIFFGNFNRVMEQANRLLVEMLPFLESITQYIMQGLPNAFRFLREQGERVLPTLGAFTETLINTLVSFSELGITLFNAVLPVFGVFLKMIQLVADAFNALPDAITESGLMIVAAIVLLRRAVNFFDELIERLSQSGEYFNTLARDIFDFTNSMIAGEKSFNAFNDELARFIEMRKEALPDDEPTRFYDATQNVQSGGFFETLQDIAFIDRLYKLYQGSSLLANGLRALVNIVKPAIGALGTLAAVFATVAGVVYFLRDGLSVAVTRFSEIFNLTKKSDGMFSDLGKTFHLVGQFVKGFVEALTAVGQTLINIFSIGAIRNFEIIAGILDFILNDIGPLNEIVAGLEGGLELVNAILRDMLQTFRDLGTATDNFLKDAANVIERRINRVIKVLNEAIRRYNSFLNSNAGAGLRSVGVDNVDPLNRVDFRSQDFNREDDRQTSSGTDVEMNFTENVTNNTEVDAQPEDKERFRKLVEDALEEANTFRRKQQGYSG